MIRIAAKTGGLWRWIFSLVKMLKKERLVVLTVCSH